MSKCYPRNYGILMNEHLPLEAVNKGCTFREVSDQYARTLNFVLADRNGWELYNWNDAAPNQGELWDKCRELKLME